MPFFVLRRRLRKRAFDAPLYHKKSHNQRLRDLLQFRDSVGIRTQDPQLRRLLLYPAELPNRSVMFFRLSLGMWDIARDKSGCKGSVFFLICNTVGGNFVSDVRLSVGCAVKSVLLEPWHRNKAAHGDVQVTRSGSRIENDIDTASPCKISLICA